MPEQKLKLNLENLPPLTEADMASPVHSDDWNRLGAGWYLAPFVANAADAITTDMVLNHPNSVEHGGFGSLMRNDAFNYGSRAALAGFEAWLINHLVKRGRKKEAKIASALFTALPLGMATNNALQLRKVR